MIDERHVPNMSGFRTGTGVCSVEGDTLSTEHREHGFRYVFVLLLAVSVIVSLDELGELASYSPPVLLASVLVGAVSIGGGYYLVTFLVRRNATEIPLDSIQRVEIVAPSTPIGRTKLRIWHGDGGVPKTLTLSVHAGLFGDTDEELARARETFEDAGIPVESA
jgi:hypothetical protein